MDHKNIARMLKIAGAIALAGILSIFYVYMPVRAAQITCFKGLCIAVPALLGLPYLFALGCYFKICGRIAADRSFCAGNVRSMAVIARLMAVSAGLWAVCALALFLTGAGNPLVDCIARSAGTTGGILRLIAILAAAAGIAVSLVAKMMSLLLNRAEEMQADIDLTI